MTNQPSAAMAARTHDVDQSKRPSLRRVRPRDGSKNIIVMGSPPRCRAVQHALSRFEADVRTLDWSEAITDAANETTIGVVVSDEPPTAPLWKSVQTLCQILPRGVPVAVVVSEDTVAAVTRRLYAAGASVVFEWPRESLLMGRVLAEILQVELARGPAKHADIALERTIEAHLQLVSSRLGKIHADVTDGMVSLSGSVDGLWMRAEAEAAATFVPGVTGVLTHGIVVEDREPDDEIRTAVLTILRNAAAPDIASTVAVTVSDGYVVLAGTVPAKEDADCILDLVSRLRGVRDIENDVVPSMVEQARDTEISALVRKVVKTLVPQGGVDVACFSGVAVLSGGVPSMVQRRGLVRAVGRVASVERVIDKLLVEG